MLTSNRNRNQTKLLSKLLRSTTSCELNSAQKAVTSSAVAHTKLRTCWLTLYKFNILLDLSTYTNGKGWIYEKLRQKSSKYEGWGMVTTRQKVNMTVIIVLKKSYNNTTHRIEPLSKHHNPKITTLPPFSLLIHSLMMECPVSQHLDSTLSNCPWNGR